VFVLGFHPKLGATGNREVLATSKEYWRFELLRRKHNVAQRPDDGPLAVVAQLF
jgi:hypothetical protein